MSEVLDLTANLVERHSISPDDAGCQELLRSELDRMGFEVVDYTSGNTINTWAIKRVSEGPTLAFAGHTDVVPPGNYEDWTLNGKLIYPFDITESNGNIYGRGVADMKGSLAAMTVAVKEFLTERDPSEVKGNIAFLLTSDEEDERVDGTQVVTRAIKNQGQTIDYAVVGEASSVNQVGDRIYVARRGSYHLKKMVINGLVGHVAKGNGIDAAEVAIRLQHAGYDEEWEANPDTRFPPTSFKTWTIDGGFEAENMVSGRTVIRANWRNNPASNGDSIRTRFESIASGIYDEVASGREPKGERFDFDWSLSGEPYATPKEASIVSIAKSAILKTLGIVPELSGGGGTSDGGTIAELGAEVVEIGLQGNTIHEASEHVPTKSLEELKDVYKAILVEALVA